MRTEKKGKKGKKEKHMSTPAYVRCTFQLDEMPIRVPLPMVYPPMPWTNSITEEQRKIEEDQLISYQNRVLNEDKMKFVLWDSNNVRSIRRLCGGYLTSKKRNGHVKKSFSLLTSPEAANFDIHCTDGARAPEAEQLCRAVERLQAQPFRINVKFLNFIKRYWDAFRSYGLVMPEALAYLNVTEALEKLRSMYHSAEYRDVRKNFQFQDLNNLLLKNIQQANFEQATLKLAEAYSGYIFYLPVFLDFRGRNYRHGPFHLHERDLLRGLFLFAREDDYSLVYGSEAIERVELTSQQMERFYAATAFHYEKYANYKKGCDWYKTGVYDLYRGCVESNGLEYGDIPAELYQMVYKAKNPFQFLASTLAILHNDSYSMRRIPITQDASASAYQLTSHLMTSPQNALRTNLIHRKPVEKDGCTIKHVEKIYDIYEFMLERLKLYAKKGTVCSREVGEKIEKTFNRKIVKMFFMPIIYGKTRKTAVKQLKGVVGDRWAFETICEVVDICFTYWKLEFGDVCDVMELVKAVCTVAVKLDNKVVYGNHFFRSIQNYCDYTEVPLTVYYDRLKRKKSTVTLKERTDVKDLRKSLTSIFANFIHQKDAFMVVNVVLQLVEEEERIRAFVPIYTIHDNFLTTIDHVDLMPQFYRDSISLLGHPSLIKKQFLIDNLIIHALQRGLDEKHFKNAADWKYIVDYVIKFDPHLRQEFPEYMGEGGVGERGGSLTFRRATLEEWDKFEMAKLEGKSVRELDHVMKSKGGVWVTPFYKDDLNPIPRTVINKCIEFCIPKELSPSEKVNWRKSMARLNKAYARYNKRLFEGGGVGRWLDYYEGLCELEGSEDYCLHH